MYPTPPSFRQNLMAKSAPRLNRKVTISSKCSSSLSFEFIHVVLRLDGVEEGGG
ncbi:hypothetical protein NEUTE1DRAFT_115770 [Neurospora tetrasperma FGSC 2508]|uniref:Uncharacterized protein n=1 Tax=Neurospora tetrasperma (strain FGSC 2508 / ATCC MYA-4615 / P0657) TaxID=510951 RepID=F8MD05_NEUT8|nr:uncharacterized protein NEUTE1DRAFT_115770 [Neurospora tetrasperma FGSC 2508]EGO60549.1 hypothetical protein NEUTE1DRAFT_115770 [Neurospora tetrasperma FGSC 2508]EGZ75474.1 hypothetical protein NEUTE2DRAFT_143711 [Neurospora tetrasperma FGSC 2509]